MTALRLAARRLLVAFPVVVAAAAAATCRSPTLVSQQLVRQREAWNATGITHYTFVYQESGFDHGANAIVANVEVNADTVVRAVDGAGATVYATGARYPTIDAIFDRITAAQSGKHLSSATFDPVAGYPTQAVISGTTGIVGILQASAVTAVP